MFVLQAAQLGVHFHQPQPWRIVDEQRRFHQLVGRHLQAAALVGIQKSSTKTLLIHSRFGADHARQQRFLGHFQRKDGHRFLDVWMRRHVLCDVQRQRRLSH